MTVFFGVLSGKPVYLPHSHFYPLARGRLGLSVLENIYIDFFFFNTSGHESSTWGSLCIALENVDVSAQRTLLPRGSFLRYLPRPASGAAGVEPASVGGQYQFLASIRGVRAPWKRCVFFFHLSENKENGVLYCHNLCRCFPVLKNSVPFLVGAI